MFVRGAGSSVSVIAASIWYRPSQCKANGATPRTSAPPSAATAANGAPSPCKTLRFCYCILSKLLIFYYIQVYIVEEV
ncbi:hypothetical protein VNO78_03996 [Psophocarpus tetragonolobus]|uniref:Uncharacterized protein n=1 Tax=Psophocarpus tetragonolobus TaxID=3891 RepID=A0AAN9XX74_PSOTE